MSSARDFFRDARGSSLSPRRGYAELLLDAAGRRRSPATMPGFTLAARRGTTDSAIGPIRRPWVAVMRAAGDGRHGCGLRGLIVVL